MLITRLLAFCTALLLLPVSFSRPAETTTLQVTDTVAITNATLIDGSGTPPRKNAVVILKGNEITVVGQSSNVKIPAGARVIDARGLILAPGFIDTHNHSDRGLGEEPSAATQVSQGITTLAIGQDGGSPFPIAEYFQNLEGHPVAVNVLTFVGHATVRAKVMGDDTNRHATPEEIEKMKSFVDQGMRDGAYGLSTGLEYETGKPATTEEIISLAQVASKYGGIYISHMRDEADKSFESFAEMIRISREAKLPAQVSHIKLGTVGVWGQSRKAVQMIEKARRSGLDITADCYPYDAWSSTIRVLVPSGRHDDPVDVARAIADVGGPANITIVSCRAHPDYEFKTMEAIAKTQKLTPVQLYMQIVKDGGAGVVCHSMKDSDIRTFYQQPWVMVSSDGGVGSRHPRGAGSFPRVLGLFARERHWFTLSEAIRKMTSLPAWRLGLKDRGLIKVGYRSDLVLLDPNEVIDRSTFEQPQLIASGIKKVFVNGREVWDGEKVTGAKPGWVLRHRSQ
jgi:N-acyl-D-amino-acid deacylase